MRRFMNLTEAREIVRIVRRGDRLSLSTGNPNACVYECMYKMISTLKKINLTKLKPKTCNKIQI